MKVLGSVKNVAKKPKEELIKAYEKMYEDGAFKVYFEKPSKWVDKNSRAPKLT